jgi:hypothetical protein
MVDLVWLPLEKEKMRIEMRGKLGCLGGFFLFPKKPPRKNPGSLASKEI